jgi:hypothetical protein
LLSFVPAGMTPRADRASRLQQVVWGTVLMLTLLAGAVGLIRLLRDDAQGQELTTANGGTVTVIASEHATGGLPPTATFTPTTVPTTASSAALDASTADGSPATEGSPTVVVTPLGVTSLSGIPLPPIDKSVPIFDNDDAWREEWSPVVVNGALYAGTTERLADVQDAAALVAHEDASLFLSALPGDNRISLTPHLGGTGADAGIAVTLRMLQGGPASRGCLWTQNASGYWLAGKRYSWNAIRLCVRGDGTLTAERVTGTADNLSATPINLVAEPLDPRAFNTLALTIRDAQVWLLVNDVVVGYIAEAPLSGQYGITLSAANAAADTTTEFEFVDPIVRSP